MSCYHKFIPAENAQYEVCVHCATYHSTANVPPESIYGADYWSEKYKHSTIDDQVYNCDTHQENGVTKNQFILGKLLTLGRDLALEIGCAPGILLKRLRKDTGFKEVCGIEVSQSYEADIRRIGDHKGRLLFGFFPEVAKRLPEGRFDLVVGLDVFEHCPNPEAFILGCTNLLRSGGQLILMCPMNGAKLPARFFDPVEHLWIHDQYNLEQMLADYEFLDIEFSAWTPGHETVSAIKL